jgi:hypothetical protein
LSTAQAEEAERKAERATSAGRASRRVILIHIVTRSLAV